MKISKIRFIFTAFVSFLFSSNLSTAMPDLKLPFHAGESWQVTRGYENPDCLINPLTKCTTHTNLGSWIDDRYALDMTENGCDSWNKPTVAIANGDIAQIQSDNIGSYGRYVIIDHGDKYRSRYAHLNSISVTLNQKVSQGQEIGRVGNSGTGVVGSACPDHPGTHLHIALYRDGTAVMPEPMSGYTNFTGGQTYISNNYFTDFNFNDGTSQGWMPGNDARNIPFISTLAGAWTVGASDFDGVGGAHPGILSPIFNGLSTNHFSSLRFTVKISTQLSGVKQGDVWIKTSDGDWNHNFIFTHISDNGNGFHTYQVAFTAGIALNQISIELTKNNVYEEWEFDEIRLMGRKPMAPNLKIMNWH